ncbi:hypothetical protein JW949_02825 [Candidatus Woesearchaeota archaeon]|nr:hypothetical protein [Candidatus Woesearchaeota archaeon]
MNRIFCGLTALLIIVLLAGCAQNNEFNYTGPVITETINMTIDETNNETDINYSNVYSIVKGEEGDLIELKPEVIDPDGDDITVKYSEPFNENGLWQTYIGDAGQYLVTITASDGKTEASVNVLVIVNKTNRAPVIECPEEINIKEGEELFIDCNIYDIEEDPLDIEYSGWINSNKYTPGYEEEGEHTVIVTVSDEKHTVKEKVKVNVENVNRAPVIKTQFEDITIMETEIAVVNTEAYDPDSDNIDIAYSEPFDNEGKWKTEIGDAGEYIVNVVVSDGELKTKESFTLTVEQKNTAPVLQPIANITVYEGETITIRVEADDRENDDLIVIYSGWMKSKTYTTDYDDAGEYNVIVTVSDGFLEDSQNVHIIVLDKNRPPVFVKP